MELKTRILKLRMSTIFQLGLANVASILLYRFVTRSLMIEKLMPKRTGYRDRLFSVVQTSGENLVETSLNIDTLEEAKELCSGNLRLFSNRFFNVGSPPNWFWNPINDRHFPNPDLHWSKLSDFNSDFGDIKCIWELSRFDWALILARAYRLTADKTYLTVLNEWASDWTEKNPLNVGPNWKCGQEAAIRMLQVLLAAYLLRQHRVPSSGLSRFVVEHCRRIVPTIRYAIAQNNNHGTSEAAALYTGGAWLFSFCKDDKKTQQKARYWHRLGRRWLENRVRRLVASDGSFSQYSLNYHRVLLDTLNIVEFWRRKLQLPEFSAIFYEYARAAVQWLYQMTNPETGDGPNFGANDGARLFVLSSTDYRDYRPSVQLGTVLFLGERVYGEGPWDDPLIWLGLDKCNSFSPSHHFSRERGGEDEMRDSRVGDGTRSSTGTRSKLESIHSKVPAQSLQFDRSSFLRKRGRSRILLVDNPSHDSRISKNLKTREKECKDNPILKKKSCVMPHGGYIIMSFEKSARFSSWGVIRCPNYHFRPSHADALHLDLWYNRINLLRDSGSYSYHVDEPWQTYFPGTAAHNTVQFDERDQMPRLGRFLFGEWLKMEKIGELIEDDGVLTWTGSYVDFKKCRHQRTVSSDGMVWEIIDEIEGFHKKAVLRWRLVPGNWVLDGFKCVGELAELSIDCNTSITRFELVEGWESRYYMDKAAVPVLEVQVEPGKAILQTEIHLKR